MDAQRYAQLAQVSSPHAPHDDRLIFDNRVRAADCDHDLGEMGFMSSESERIEYYSAKFDYYARRCSALIESGYERSAADPPRGVCDEAIEIWDSEFADEVLVYATRILQGPDDVVRVTWYNELAPFGRWADLTSQLVRECGSAVIADALNVPLPLCVSEEAAVMEEVKRITLDVAPNATRAGPLFVLGNTERVNGVVEAILERLERELSRREADKQAALTVIVEEIKTAFDVRICDLLLVKAGRGFPVLDLAATSWVSHHLDEVRAEEAVYSFGGGITGSAFLVRRSDPIRWLGTSVLDADRRQSEYHAERYRSVYGTVEAFCVLPIYQGTKVSGALRLIDPMTVMTGEARLGRPGTWPAGVRLELAQLSEWLSTAVPVLNLALRDRDTKSVLAEVEEYEDWLAWARPRYKAGLLRDCVAIASMRDEHRAVSAAIMACKPASYQAFCRGTEPYPSVPEDRRAGYLTDAGDLYGRVLPGAGVFVCPDTPLSDPYVRGCRYHAVQATRTLSPAEAAEKIKQLDDCAIFAVDGDCSVVRVIEAGRWSADYYLSEKLGRWRLRERATVERRIHEWLPQGVPQAFVSWFVSDVVIPYSYSGHGAILVITDRAPRDQMAEYGFVVGDSVKEMDTPQFTTIASVDGGTWIDFQGRIREAGIIFESKPDPERRRIGGSRHQTARSLSRFVEPGIVVAVSANRSITLFAKGHDERQI